MTQSNKQAPHADDELAANGLHAATEEAAAAGDETVHRPVQDGDPAQAPTPEPDPLGLPEPDPLEVLTIENAELKDRLLRAIAETENLRRRAEREKAEATLYAATNFARDLLSVSDNMNRALDAVDANTRETANEGMRNLLTGIDMTQRELMNIFERHGIRCIDPMGEKFNPNQHQAMFEIPNPEVPAGTVVQVAQAGFIIGERVLRPAMVGVSSGGGKRTAVDMEAKPEEQ